MTKPVIFRKYDDGELVALLPTVPAGEGKTACLGFTQQHGAISADVSIMRITKEATPEEYVSLLQDVVHSGHYPLRPVKRIKEAMNAERQRAMKHRPLPASVNGKRHKETQRLAA